MDKVSDIWFSSWAQASFLWGTSNDENGHDGNADYTYKDESYAPEGCQGWTIVAAAFLSILIAEGMSRSFSTIFERTTDVNELGGTSNETSPDVMSTTERSTVELTLNFVTILTGPIACGLAEKFGFRQTAMLGSLFATIGILLSWAISPAEPNFNSFLFGYGIFAGIGFGTMFSLSIGIVGLYFDKNRALVIGIIMMGPNVGGMLSTPATQLFSEFGGGWQGALWFHGGLCAISFFLAFAYKPRPKRTVKVLKSELELSDDAISIVDQLRSLLSSPSFLILLISGTFVVTGLVMSMDFIISRAFKILREEEALNLLTALAISNFAGRIGFAILVNKVGRPLLIWNVMLTLGAFANGAHLLSNEFWAMITCAVLVGLCLGMHASLRPILIMNLAKENMFNMAQGISLFFSFIGGAIQVILQGVLIENSGYLETPLHVGGGLLLLAALMCYPLSHIQVWEESRNRRRVINRISTCPSSSQTTPFQA